MRKVELLRRIRPYQERFWEAIWNNRQDRLIEIAHRRWGKDEICLAGTQAAACVKGAPRYRVGNYWHCLPEYAQGRKALWEGVNAHTGRRRIDEAFPEWSRERTDNTQMLIEFKNGSTWQIIGSDRYDATVGSGPVGIVYSEWALANPSAWGYHRPMLEENGGWAAFITTPRGSNHAKAMFDMAEKNDRWFSELSSVLQTQALSQEQLDESLTEYQAIYGDDFGLAYFEQEYLCSFSGAMVGSIFGGEIARAERNGQIGVVDIDWDHPVHTAWDLGKAVNNPIWCFQVLPGEAGPRIVDFYRPDDDDLTRWVAWLNDRGYVGNDYVPHDILVTEWGTTRTRIDTLRLLGRSPVRIPMVSVQDGINAGNQTIKVAEFDAKRCAVGIEGLKAYRRAWDDEMKTFREKPVKDWSEHIGSAFRYLGLAWRAVEIPKKRAEKKTELVYTARADGSVIGNMSVQEAVEAMVKRRRNR